MVDLRAVKEENVLEPTRWQSRKVSGDTDKISDTTELVNITFFLNILQSPTFEAQRN